MAPIAIKLWHSLIARHAMNVTQALRKGLKALEQRVALEAIPIRNTPKQPLHPLARIRQSQSRWYSTARDALDRSTRSNSLFGPKSGQKFKRSALPQSATRSYIQSSSHRAPFASTLRPNLTGGTLGRTAGGYNLGSGRVGGARFFSHGPASQAHVVQNVSQGIRAFFTSGQKAHYDGLSPRGEKRFKAVSPLQQEKMRKMQGVPKASPGSRIEFAINPTITALTSLRTVAGYSSSSAEPHSLNSAGLLDALSVDFSRSLKDLAAVLDDLERLASLGDLPISYEASHLKVHFPGCDARLVEGLCEELHVRRGLVVQDEAFDSFTGTEIALLFPFAPSRTCSASKASNTGYPFDPAFSPLMAPHRHVIDVRDMLTEPSAYSTQSDVGSEDASDHDQSWQSVPDDYQSCGSGSLPSQEQQRPLEYEVEGIYEFIKALDELGR